MPNKPSLTAKFPLQVVFGIMDVFLAEGINTIFHVALALLRASRSEMLLLDFEVRAHIYFFRMGERKLHPFFRVEFFLNIGIRY